MKPALLAILLLSCLCVAAASAQANAGAGFRELAPGEIITLNFPELLPMADQVSTRCEIHIPATYEPGRDFPLLLWFSGGKGSCHVRSARDLVDFNEFVVVALPSPEGRSARLAVKGGEIDAFWAYHAPMLEAVKQAVPNIDPELRLVGGSSNGAHIIGSGLSRDWRGFSDYFTAYILHEGGYALSKDYSRARVDRSS